MKLASKRLIISFLLLTYTCLLVMFSLNPDQFFMIASGNDVLNGHLTYNTNLQMNYVLQQWLYSVVLAFIDNHFGYVGDILFTLIQNIVLWFLSYKFLKKKIKSDFWATIIPIVLILINFFYVISVRPSTITLILLLSEILILEKYKETKNWKQLFWLIPILILLANVHQSIYLYCGIVAMPYMIEGKKLDWKVIISGLLMLPISLLTPYGLDGALYIFRAMIIGQKYIRIQEMQSAAANIAIYAYVCLAIIGLVGVNYFKKANKFINFYMILTICMTIMTLRSILFIFIPMLFIAKNFDFSVFSDVKIFKESLVTTIVMSALTALILFNAPALITFDLNDELDLVEHYIALEIPKNAKIYNVPDSGGILEYNGYNIYLDTRPDAYDKENTERFREFSIIDGGINGARYVSDTEILKETEKFEYLITYTNSRLDNIYKDMNYEPLYRNGMYVIYKSNLLY